MSSNATPSAFEHLALTVGRFRFLKPLRFSATSKNGQFMTSSAKKASRAEVVLHREQAQSPLVDSPGSADSPVAEVTRSHSLVDPVDLAEDVEGFHLPTQIKYSSKCITSVVCYCDVLNNLQNIPVTNGHGGIWGPGRHEWHGRHERKPEWGQRL